ncbi:hypothetical protein N7475_006772 [Penicillium sp. IBT 31633x]|nr:hypothetical protein N7475_006772 [Penicillium sp. IBT 31633x]
MRGKVRTHPYNKGPRDPPTSEGRDHHSNEHNSGQRPILNNVNDVSVPRPPTPASHGETASTISEHLPPAAYTQPAITNEIRARIIATLATLKGKRGAPFSFVTSGASGSQSQQSFEQSQSTPLSLKLSWLLRPLKASPWHGGRYDSQQSTEPVKMPSYAASMTLGQTVTDPVEGGMISLQASMALFEYFMLQMNAKWEYVLDPHVDTHSDVRKRSPLLFASILFCASKFTNFINGNLVPATDPYMQSRLCSLARNLAIKTIAEGDRSIETMQAFYLLVCWKDKDDDISYLHSGYAFRILHDLDLEQGGSDRRQEARRRRTWLALFRQDRQQSLFFMRRASLSLSDEDPPSVGDLDTWLKMSHALP